MNSWAWALIILLVGVILPGFIFLGANPDLTAILFSERTTPVTTQTPAATTDKTEKTPEPTAEPEAATTAATAYTDQLTVTYSGYTSPQIGGHIYPRDKYVFLIVDMVIENGLYESFPVRPLEFYAIVYKDKYSADISSASDLSDELNPVQLESGDYVSGKIAYEVPDTEFILEFRITHKYEDQYNINWIKE